MSTFEIKAEFKTSPNIAVIKYWGKLEESYILPLNTSLGFTLNTDDLCTRTKVILSTENKQDSLLLNGKEYGVNDRLQRILNRFRELYLQKLVEQKNKDNGNEELTTDNFRFFRIESVNDFPTASGLASSASGLAAISVCLCEIFNLPEKLSEIARLGSGSACRSVYGGLVQWNGPELNVLKDFYSQEKSLKSYSQEQLEQLSGTCISQQLFADNQMFKKIKILIFCAHFSAKEVPSTGGMKQSTQTSQLLEYRVQNSVVQNINEIKQAIQDEDYDKFAEVTIRDSNQFHAVCMDTQPPIFYLNEFSKFLISIVEKLNQILPKKIAYTYDAGPHGVLFIHEDTFDVAFEVFRQVYKFDTEMLNTKGLRTLQNKKKVEISQEVKDIIQFFIEKDGDQPSYVIQTDVGNGPQKL